MAKFQIGDVIDYKVKKGRGRPACGRIIENKGVKVLVEDYAKKQTWVNYSHILRPHIVRYVRKGSQSEQKAA